MANEKTIAIRIRADGSVALVELDKVESKIEKQPGLLKNLRTHWLGITAAITALGFATKKAFDFAEQSAKFKQSRAAFQGMVQGMGRDAKEEFAKLNDAAAGLIDRATLTEAANRAMSLGIPIEHLGRLMDISRAKARDMGITTTQAFNDIVTGIGRGSPLIIDNLGLTLKIGEANKQYAAALDKTVEQLTAQEKKMAILNATMTEGEKALARHNLQVLTAFENMQKWKVQLLDFKIILGQVVISIGAGITAILFSISAFVNKVIEGMARSFQRLFFWMAKIPGIGEKFKGLENIAKSVAENSAGAVDDAINRIKTSLAALVGAWADEQVARQNNNAATEQNNKAHNDKLTKQDIAAMRQRMQIQGQLQQYQMNSAAAALDIIAALTRNKYKAIFIAQRGMHAAQAIISGHAAAAAALAPPPLGLGPVVGAPLATWAKLQGYLSAAAIMAQAFMSPSPGGGAGGAAPVFPANPATGLPTEPTVSLPNITINLIDAEGTTKSTHELTADMMEELRRNNGTINGLTIPIESNA